MPIHIDRITTDLGGIRKEIMDFPDTNTPRLIGREFMRGCLDALVTVDPDFNSEKVSENSILMELAEVFSSVIAVGFSTIPFMTDDDLELDPMLDDSL